MNQPNESLIVRKTQTSLDRSMDFSFFLLASELQGKTEDEIEMMKAMGFASFDSTKVNPLSMKIVVSQDGLRRVNIQKVPQMHMERVSNRNVVIGKRSAHSNRFFQL